jgi:hypothetical protein
MLEVLQNGTQVRSFFLVLFLFRASEARISDVGGAAKWDPGTQFTCFTGTKVQLLTQKALLGAQFVCFTGTKVQILTQKLCAGRETCGCFGCSTLLLMRLLAADMLYELLTCFRHALRAADMLY